MKYQLTPYQQKKCREFFLVQKKGDYIYAGHLKSKLSIDITTAYKMLEELKEQEYLSVIYEVYCYSCSRSKGIFLESLSDFDKDGYCDYCGIKLSPFENIIVLYKVIST